LAHPARSTISPFKGFGRARFGFQICVKLFSIRVIVCQSGVDLCKRKMAELFDDFLWNESRVIQLSDSTDGDASARNIGTPTMDPGATLDQAADLGDWHCPDYIEFSLVSDLVGYW
jgi:hypothetical protein